MKKQAFLQVVNVMSAFCKTITLNKKEYSAVEAVLKGNIKIDYLGMGLAETWRGAPDPYSRSFNINGENDVPILCSKVIQMDNDSSLVGTITTSKSKLEIKKLIKYS